MIWSVIRRRRVQTVVIGLVAAAAVTATVLGAGLLVASRAPFDDAFRKQHGAHLTVQADSAKVTGAQLAASGSAAGVVAAAGPYPLMVVGSEGNGGGPPMPPMTIVARPDAGGDVDRVELRRGRWATGPNEIVMSGGGTVRLPVGMRITLGAGTEFTVVGLAQSVSGTANAWVLPSAVAALGGADSWQMVYRLASAATPSDVEAGRAAVAATLPDGAVTTTRSWLDVRQRAVRQAGVFVPFLVAFALLAIVMAVLVVGTVVAGAVGAATRRIGILKALGCTPAGIVRAYVTQALVPALVGAGAGCVVGNVIALPVLAETEEVYGSANTTLDWWVTLLAAGAVLGVVAVTAWAASLRAGRLRTVEAIAVGRAPSSARGRWAVRLIGRLPVPRAVGLGLARPFARPVRTAAILLAVAFGAAAATFATGLGESLVRIQTASQQDTADVTLEPRMVPPSEAGGPAPDDPAPSPGLDAADVLAEIAAREGTAAAYGKVQRPVSAAGVTDPITATVLTGDFSWAGFQLVSGRWFTAPGEAVAGAPFLTAAGAEVGDTVTIQVGGTPVPLRIVGEIFETGSGIFTGALPGLEADQFLISVTGDPSGYASALSAAFSGRGLEARVSTAEVDPLLLVVQGLTATLTLLLIAVAALGVLNMLILDLRDRVHDLGVHKALGMTPRQTIAMVTASVAGIGLLGGLLGVPIGIAVQRVVLPAMAASGGLRLPDSLIDVYGPALLTALALGGPAIALLGALLPAGWAARTRTATALRTE